MEHFYAERFKHFNAIQTQCFNSIHNSSESVLVCAPKGSGKKILGEIALLQHLKENTSSNEKCVYLCSKKVCNTLRN